jgi:hypothetical protein
MPKIYIRPAPERVAAALPNRCYARHPETGQPVIVERGRRGFAPTRFTIDVERANGLAGVTAAQVIAMTVGAEFGFDRPEADPLNWPEARDSSWLDARQRWSWAGALAASVVSMGSIG